MRKLLKAIRSERGFTLIELLVVIGILAALAGVVTLGVTQFIGRGCNEAAKTELHNIQTAVSACMVDDIAANCATTEALVTKTLLLTAPKGTYTITDGVAAQDTYLPCVQ